MNYETWEKIKTKYVDPFIIGDGEYSTLKAGILATSAPHGCLFATVKKDGKEYQIANGKVYCFISKEGIETKF